MFNFVPVSEEDIQKANLLEKGDYKFFVKKAEQKRSKAGNAMIELQLSILGKDNRDHLIFDYLMDHEAMRYKIRHFCYSIGLGDKYELGVFSPEECIERIGYAKVYIKEDPTGQYKSKNSISDYIPIKKDQSTVPHGTFPSKTMELKKEEFFNDDLPF